MNWLVHACFLATILLSAPLASSGEAPGMTERQREILHELDIYQPPWGGGGGWLLREWDSDSGLDGLVNLPYGGENAAKCFSRLEEYYPDEKESLTDGGADARGVDELLLAADMGTCRFVPDYYPEFDAMRAKQPDFDALRDYLQGLLRRAERAMQAGRAAEAERCYRAALVCGWHLTNDKTNSLVYVTGLVYKVRGAQGYAGFLLRSGNREKAEAARNYARMVAELMRAFNWKANVALSEFAGFACLPAAIRISTGDSEVFWRKEAIMRLGTLRYGIPDEKAGTVERNPVFELAADEALAAVAREDADVSVRRLAVWLALNVTPRDYAGMEHRFSESVLPEPPEVE